MLMYALFALVFLAGAKYIWEKRLTVGKDFYNVYLVGTIALLFFAVFFGYSYFYFLEIGWNASKFNNCGEGILIGNSTVNKTMFMYNDTQMVEYFGAIKGDSAVVSNLSPNLYLIVFFFVFWVFIHYINVYWYSRNK